MFSTGGRKYKYKFFEPAETCEMSPIFINFLYTMFKISFAFIGFFTQCLQLCTVGRVI